jgi:hypothetical protein
MLRQGTVHLVKMSEKLDYPWTPDVQDPMRLHNMYARSLVTCYVSKFAQLSETILDSIEDQRFLVYALAGRSLIETTATLRYYLMERYKPLLDKGSLTNEDMKKLIEIDDQHLRGGRFDWESFFTQRYDELKAAATQALADKKDKTKKAAAPTGTPQQTSVQTCIDKWGKESPEFMVIYNLFCDLVHPNLGSTFLVASMNKDGLHFTLSKGSSMGAKIFEQSLPMLLSATMKPFGDYLGMLMATIYHDDELPG